jgi:hypothetical protein
MVNVVVAKKRTVQVSSNATAGIIDSTVPVTLKNFQIGGATRLDKLVDVDASAETDKATLVYDTVSDKYIVKQLEFSEIVGTLDGGEF